MRPLRPAVDFEVFVGSCPTNARPLVRALRRIVLRCAPGASEAIRFNSLCYFLPGAPFGSIGGNICMIEADDRCVRLSFIHGASLPDPAGLLRGSAKAKRYIDIRSTSDLRRAAIRALIRASAAHAASAAA